MFNFYRLESQIEEEYLNSLRQACYREKSYSKYKDIFYVKSIAMIYLECFSFDVINCLVKHYYNEKICKFSCHVFVIRLKKKLSSPSNFTNFISSSQRPVSKMGSESISEDSRG